VSIAGWLRGCQNPRSVEQLFDETRGLDRVELHKMILHRDGPRLQLRFQLPRFADRPSPRWHPEHNALQVTMSFWGVAEATLTGWTGGNVGELRVLSESPYRLEFTGEGVVVRCAFEKSRVDGVAAFQEAPP
jgi:hypothetical protein